MRRLTRLVLLLTAALFTTLLSASAGSRPSRTTDNLRWHIQFTGPLVVPRDAQYVFLDLFETEASVVSRLTQQGKRVICYLNAGAWEDWRPDATVYPQEILGKPYEGWPGERWVDIRRLDLLAPILQARLDLCRAKGFFGVDPDNLNGFLNDTGFPLTADDQLRFNRWLAAEAHARGLAIGLKNDAEQAAELVTDFDWILVESCVADGWCALTAPFRQAGKPVFAIEYVERGIPKAHICRVAQRYGLSAQLKRRELDAWSKPCWR